VATANTGTWSNSALARATSVGTYGKTNHNAVTHRSFTGHEPIDEVGIIHMTKISGIFLNTNGGP
jgi:hypothetical protein